MARIKKTPKVVERQYRVKKLKYRENQLGNLERLVNKQNQQEKMQRNNHINFGQEKKLSKKLENITNPQIC